MTYGNHSFVARLHQTGREVDVLERQDAPQNKFGNTESTYDDESNPSRTVIAVRTYPNRNTEVNSNSGDYNRDKPIFLVPIGDNQPDPPSYLDQIVYDGIKYEVKSHTEYDTHVEFFGNKVLHDG